MTTQTHRITNRTKGRLLSEGVHAVDATFEHLTVLRVLIEGLADNNEAGFWLTQVRGIPSVPRISPIDLIYVDREQRVVEAVELLPAGQQPPFREPAVSALVLPFQTISATETSVGDQLLIDGAPSAKAEPSAAAPIQTDKLLPVAEPAPVQEQPPAAEPVSVAVETPFRESAPLPLAVMNAVAPVEAAAPASMPIEAAPTPAPVPVRPAAPTPVLTVHEVVLPAEAETAPAQHTQLNRTKRQKLPRSRKARREAAVAQRNKDAVAAARQRREQEQAGPEQAPAAPALEFQQGVRRPAPQPVAAAPYMAPRPVSDPPARQKTSAAARRFDDRIQRTRTFLYSYLRMDLLMDASTSINGEERGKVMALVSRVLHWLNPNAVSEEQRASIRRPAKELVAYTGPEGEEKKIEVGDISSSGVYLRTDERWELGKKVALSLQRNGPVSEIPDRHVEVEADTVRHDKHGMGMAFILPEKTHLDLWDAAASGQTAETGPDYIVHEMRLAQALGVIRRICPELLETATHLFRKDFSSVRVRDSVRILLIVEKMLPSTPENDKRKAPAELVARILEMGSWASEEWTQGLWAGLLATSCTPTGDDLSNSQLVDILCQLAHVHLRILEFVCSRHADVSGGASGSPTVTMREVTKLIDLTNLTKTLRSVSEMADMGLVTPIKRSPSDPQDENAKTTVTPLGLRMFARCHGRIDN
ncbi:MAG TPA: PilZ domain-containing protein [Terracidiphilus sp.]|nr:PilZ domain-containing protein [Terracidiphilus sp.]